MARTLLHELASLTKNLRRTTCNAKTSRSTSTGGIQSTPGWGSTTIPTGVEQLDSSENVQIPSDHDARVIATRVRQGHKLTCTHRLVVGRGEPPHPKRERRATESQGANRRIACGDCQITRRRGIWCDRAYPVWPQHVRSNGHTTWEAHHRGISERPIQRDRVSRIRNFGRDRRQLASRIARRRIRDIGRPREATRCNHQHHTRQSEPGQCYLLLVNSSRRPRQPPRSASAWRPSRIKDHDLIQAARFRSY